MAMVFVKHRQTDICDSRVTFVTKNGTTCAIKLRFSLDFTSFCKIESTINQYLVDFAIYTLSCSMNLQNLIMI